MRNSTAFIYLSRHCIAALSHSCAGSCNPCVQLMQTIGAVFVSEILSLWPHVPQFTSTSSTCAFWGPSCRRWMPRMLIRALRTDEERDRISALASSPHAGRGGHAFSAGDLGSFHGSAISEPLNPLPCCKFHGKTSMTARSSPIHWNCVGKTVAYCYIPFNMA